MKKKRKLLSTLSVFSITPANPSVVCGLVGSVQADIECVARARPAECDEVAVELFEPMKQETQHVFEDLKCSAGAQPTQNVPSVSTEHHVGSPEVQQGGLAASSSAAPPVTAAPNSKPVPPRPSVPDDEPTVLSEAGNESPSVTEILEPPQTNEQSVEAVQKHRDEQQQKEQKPEQVRPAVRPRPKPENLRPDLTYALYSFGNVDTVCAPLNDTGNNNEVDVWAPVRRRLCARKEDILPHANCFLETAIKDKQCVVQRVSPDFLKYN